MTGRADIPRVAAAVENGIGTLTLRHPPLNILTRAMTDELRAAIESLEADPGVRVLLLRADGPHFSAGADVGEHLPPHDRELIPRFLGAIRALNEFPLPVIAAVRGRCLGGGFELAQAADIIVAGAGALFGQPEILLGVTAPAACALLPRRTAPGTAAVLLFTGDPLDAEAARATGLVHAVVDDAEVGNEALRLAGRIARHSRPALRFTKRSLRAHAMAREAEALRDAEAVYLNELMRTADALEGLNAFLEKRRPAWTHR